jgi:hypothetical protein
MPLKDFLVNQPKKTTTVQPTGSLSNFLSRDSIIGNIGTTNKATATANSTPSVITLEQSVKF